MSEPKGKILVVDDNVDTQTMTALLMRRSGYDVDVATSKQEAIEKLISCRYDVFLGDLNLPDGSGLDLMIEVKHLCTTKGIACTGFGEVEDVAETHAAGFSAHLTKPIDIQTLLQTVERVMRAS